VQTISINFIRGALASQGVEKKRASSESRDAQKANLRIIYIASLIIPGVLADISPYFYYDFFSATLVPID